MPSWFLRFGIAFLFMVLFACGGGGPNGPPSPPPTPSPIITGISPGVVEPGQNVTITGENFGSNPAGVTVTFDGIAGTIVSVSGNRTSPVLPVASVGRILVVRTPSCIQTGIVSVVVSVTGAPTPAAATLAMSFPANATIVCPAGGSLVSSDGEARVIVPSGAVSMPTRITVQKQEPGSAPPLMLGRGVLSSVWRFGPEGLRFSKDVEIILTIDDANFPPGSPPEVVTIGLDGRVEALREVRFVSARVPLGRNPRPLGPAALRNIRGLISHFSPFTSVALDLTNEDGVLDAAAVFHAAKDTFRVGDGGSARPDSLVYEVTVANATAFAFTTVVIRDSVAPSSGIIACRSILTALTSRPPSSGSPPTTCTDRGWTWNVGVLPAGTFVRIVFRAEALAVGSDINRVRVTADQAVVPIMALDEVPTVVRN